MRVEININKTLQALLYEARLAAIKNNLPFEEN